jgi:hypothetical protein
MPMSQPPTPTLMNCTHIRADAATIRMSQAQRAPGPVRGAVDRGDHRLLKLT